MAHVKTISSKQLDTLREVNLHGNRLMNLVDNAGQTLWVPLMPGHDKMIENFAAFAGNPIDAKTEKACMSYSARIASSGDAPAKFAVEELHQFLSLEHHLLPASDTEGKQGIEAALAHLNLPPVMPPEEVKEKLPALLASIQKTLAKQNETGHWLS